VSRPFAPSRPDGRSDRQVIFDLARDAEPDTGFTFDQLTAALSEGLASEVDRSRVYRAVADGNRTLLRERKRYLNNVPGVGYRVIYTSEAVSVALNKKGRAEAFLQRGLAVLKNARLDELDPAQRTLHEGQLLIMAGLYEATRQSERRHSRSEALIAELIERVDKIEGAASD
jgi:hypothetical protein